MKKKTLISIAFILAVFFALDRLGGKGMAWVYEHTNDVVAPKFRQMAGEVDQDILLLGTSRCNRHYVPSIITDSLGLTAYNAGIDATNNIYAHYMALNLVLSYHTPRVVCLEVSQDDYAEEKNAAETTSFFAPYIGRSLQIDSLFKQLGSYWPYRISHLYRYNAKAISNLNGLMAAESPVRTDGFTPHAATDVHPHDPKHEVTPAAVSPAKLHMMEVFINECRSRGIALVMTISPTFTRVDSDFYTPLKQLAAKHDIPLLDYHTPGLFLDCPDLFFDEVHLNVHGAEAYTALFAADLKKALSDLQIL